MPNSRRYKCPSCGQKTGVNIVYGMPGTNLAEAAERGEVVLGGCTGDPASPERQCTGCGHAWRIKRRGLAALDLEALAAGLGAKVPPKQP